MVTVCEVKTAKQRREFLNFPLKMYRGNPYFVPPLYGDEAKIFRRDYVYNDTCDAVYFNAYEDGKMVGRISGILQKVSNEIRHEKRVRFTRFDAVDSQEVANALFAAVEDWARSKGMDTVVGPLGFSDLEREGLLIEGFDQVSTFEEQYNADYYPKLIEGAGYGKEVDWLEFKLYCPEVIDEDMKKMSDFVIKRYKLHRADAKNVNDFLDRYADAFFALLDVGYEKLYGTVPFTQGMKDMMIANFKLIIDLKYVACIMDENEELVCLGLCFPSLAGALQKSSGHLYPWILPKLLYDIKHPKILDLGLIAVKPEYLQRGITAIVIYELQNMMKRDNIEYCETNLNLEYNHQIMNCWKRFDSVNHKRRRSYVKTVAPAAEEARP